MSNKRIAVTGKEPSIKEGWLKKQGNYIKNWRDRWFQLRAGLLVYYKEPQTESKPTNFFILQGVTVRLCDANKYGQNSFEIRMANGDSRYLCASSRVERDTWMSALRQASKMRPLSPQDEQQQRRNSQLVKAVNVPGAESQKGERLTPDHFNFIKVLGKGNYGKVMLSTLQRGDGRFFAIKVIKKSSLVDEESLEHIISENRVLQTLKHPFLVQLYCSFQTQDRLYFVMEYVNGGELFFHIGREKRFSESRVRFYASQILLALQYLHSKGIVYRDLKLENLLFDQDGNIKITDFGLVKEGIGTDDTTTTFCGTPEYLAPEILEDENYGKDVDWWALGVVLFELMVGRPPFSAGQGHNMEKLFFNILHQTINIPASLSAEARDLLRGLLQRDPSDRLGSGHDDGGSIQRHTFFDGVDWKMVLSKELVPPFRPQLSCDLDVTNFDREFTQMPTTLTPETPSKLRAVADANGLHDFSYQADSATLMRQGK